MTRGRGRQVCGILLLDKPPNISSNQALQRVRRLFDARKAGHTGNLDVLATGLLPVCFGEATKVAAFLTDSVKAYRAEVTFGIQTATDDAEGPVLAEATVPALTRAELSQLVSEFTGDIMQIPPMYSALKQAGQPLYKLARQGIEIERKPRRLTVYSMQIVEFDSPRLILDIQCSKGTYVRTLAADLGQRVGCGAYLSGLRRTAVGPFNLDQALTMDALAHKAEQGEQVIDACLLPMDCALVEKPSVDLEADNARSLCQGQTISIAAPPQADLVRLYDQHQAFLGIGEVLEDGRIAPRRLLTVKALAH